MAHLVLGPLLRYVSETEATVWVETDAACEVEILGRREPTFRSRATTTRWSGSRASSRRVQRVRGRARRRAPLARPDSELPPSAIRTLGRDKALDICFGSCRVAAAARARPTTETKDQHEDGREFDALRVLAIGDGARASATSGPSCSSCSATRSTSTRARRRRANKIRDRRGTDDAARARRSSTSRSTPGSTRSPGASR